LTKATKMSPRVEFEVLWSKDDSFQVCGGPEEVRRAVQIIYWLEPRTSMWVNPSGTDGADSISLWKWSLFKK
jgi:hypothetical protein